MFSRIDIHQYTLFGKWGAPTTAARNGVLIRFHYSNGTVGYGDCHPWPELGDGPLKQQVETLRNGGMTPLLSRTCYFAELDAKARAEGINLLTDLSIPDSHYLLPPTISVSPLTLDAIAADGFCCVKLKITRDLDCEIPRIEKILEYPSNLRFRLDFNEKWTGSECKKFVATIAPYAEKIEFLEDPFPYASRAWRGVKSLTQISMGCDRQSELAAKHINSCDILVVKPALQDLSFLSTSSSDLRRIVVTSYLDHPLGQVAAAYSAGLLNSTHPKRMLTCGLLSHNVYQTTPFSEQLSHCAPQFTIPSGTGFGFDALLEKLDWSRLI